MDTRQINQVLEKFDELTLQLRRLALVWEQGLIRSSADQACPRCGCTLYNINTTCPACGTERNKDNVNGIPTGVAP